MGNFFCKNKLELELENYKKDNDILINKINKLTNENETLYFNNKKLSTQIKHYNKDIEYYKINETELNNLINKNENKYSIIENQIILLETQLDNITNDNKILQSELSESNKINTNLEETNNTNKTIIDNLETEQKKLMDIINNYTKRIDLLDNEIDNKNKQLESLKDNLLEYIKQYMNDNKNEYINKYSEYKIDDIVDIILYNLYEQIVLFNN